ncbi:lipoprotein LpqV [Mycobacteroides abscessus subsp. bolletii]|nr:lipoprotein LpqV [Mycobacteroides abscessus]MDO2968590.1 lipoprotein LpqV [Mycobacteroides abscessus subsp. bolletii]MDO3080814.1 lipoprotein LpqV [Mycobacteroides abscessus subsp. bolletii]MDO3128994.1 lipoprotein LpqV [Mycobacteroides abscessus subsp. bolletii]MDO3334852.1 lipoprotein LpqV [Mycobacteroides abscessus subsp. bolletii]UEA49452.1 lipoprotein LpqV [Mycobacteroides abscessus subsp. abscessus]
MTAPTRIAATLMAFCVPLIGAACSSASDDKAAPSPSVTAGTTTTSLGAPAAQPPAAGSGVSPAGVTTSVNAAPSSLEEEYYQACRAAADWMTGKHDGPDQLVEGYLQSIQSTGNIGPGTFHKSWHELTADRQAAVIVATNAAAEQQCG